MRSDQDLLAAWRAGDLTAGDELVSRHWASIARFFRAKVGDDAADLISQTFLACVEGKDRIAGGEVRAYLFAIARRRLAEHFRGRLAHPEVDLSTSSLADLATGPLSQLGRHQRADLLHQALTRLPLDDQIALELFYFEELPTAAIAEVLGVEDNTARSRLARARDKLRQVLVELGGAEEAAVAESQLVGKSR